MRKSITDIKIRGYHADLYGHVNNARYLELLEEARWSHFESQFNWPTFRDRGLAFVIVNINIDYRKPAVPGDILHIHTEYKTHGSRSMTLHQTCLLNDTTVVAAEADITFVVLDAKTGKVVPLEGELLGMLLQPEA